MLVTTPKDTPPPPPPLLLLFKTQRREACYVTCHTLTERCQAENKKHRTESWRYDIFRFDNESSIYGLVFDVFDVRLCAYKGRGAFSLTTYPSCMGFPTLFYVELCVTGGWGAVCTRYDFARIDRAMMRWRNFCTTGLIAVDTLGVRRSGSDPILGFVVRGGMR